MLSSMIVIVILFVFVMIMTLYKRRMLIQMFSLNVTESANKFNEELERTANIIIKRLETQISHLEYLLDEADTKIALLEKQIRYHQNYQADVPNFMLSTPNPAENPMNNPEKNHSVPPVREEKVVGSVSLVTTGSQVQDTANADKRNLIMAMANQGYNVTEIAKATGLGKGEVMLLLQLNKK